MGHPNPTSCLRTRMTEAGGYRFMIFSVRQRWRKLLKGGGVFYHTRLGSMLLK
jgi:hypothetical protein